MIKTFFIFLILFVSIPSILVGTFNPNKGNLFPESDRTPLEDSAYVLEIGIDTALFAEVVTLPLVLTNPDSIDAMGLFLNYDKTALLLLSISRLNTRIRDWEYFEYELDQPEAGDIKIQALADLPDPVSTPPLFPAEGAVLNFIFQVILDPCPLNLSTFIRFKFADSTDNVLREASTHKFVAQDDIEYKNGNIFMRCPNETRGDEESFSLPRGYQLFQNYPNPFNPKTEINFSLSKESQVSLIIYDIKGQLVKRLVNGKLKKGEHKAVWKGTNSEGYEVSSGVYLYRLKTEECATTRKMILLR